MSGCLVAIHLLRSSRTPIAIKLIEKKGVLGRGVAYGTPHSCHRLNVPAVKMSAFPDDPDHFLRWVENREETGLDIIPGGVEPLSFVPRPVFGDYIQEQLEAARQAAPHVHMTCIQDEVVDLESTLQGTTLRLRSGVHLRADKVVLALGNFPPSDPKPAEGSFSESPLYYGFAWAPDTLAHLEPEAPVLLIGSGLTMVDQAIALRERGHRGTIHALSRRGLLPSQHEFNGTPELFTLDEVPYTTLGAWRVIRERVARATERGNDWRTVIDGLRPLTQQFWKNLPLGEKRRFLRHVRPYWDVHRHRIAPEIHRILAGMATDGVFQIHKGQLLRCDEVGDHLDVTFRQRYSTETKTIRVRRVINCTGPECDYRKFQQSLIVNLLKGGFIRPDPLALGLDVAPNGALVDAEGEISTSLFALGPPQKGIWWETTAVPEIRQQAKTLSQVLLHSMTGMLVNR